MSAKGRYASAGNATQTGAISARMGITANDAENTNGARMDTETATFRELKDFS